jgi:hypothetical protein
MNSTLDQASLEELTSILRHELEEYGALLAVLIEQQEKIMNRDPDALFEINEKVEEQMETNQGLLNRRQRLIASLAKDLGAESESTLSQLISSFPEAVQPMFHSLAEEINNLISSARRKVKQNQVLLSRLSEVAEELLHAVTPDGGVTKTYDRQGDLTISAEIGKRPLKTTA